MSWVHQRHGGPWDEPSDRQASHRGHRESDRSWRHVRGRSSAPDVDECAHRRALQREGETIPEGSGKHVTNLRALNL